MTRLWAASPKTTGRVQNINHVSIHHKIMLPKQPVRRAASDRAKRGVIGVLTEESTLPFRIRQPERILEIDLMILRSNR